MKIMDCVDACPNDALHIGFGKTSLFKRTEKRTYDLALLEEFFVAAMFLLGFFAFRRLYEFIPMLMAVGVSLVITWCVWKATKIIRDQNSSFHSWQLKFHGSLKPAGVIFLIIAVLLFVFTLHSAAIQTFKQVGDYALANNDTDTVMRYYKFASPFEDGGYALASNPNIDKEVALQLESQSKFEEAERLFRRIDERVGGDEHSTMLLGQNLQQHAQFNPIDTFYADRLDSNPDWIIIWEDYVGWMKRNSMFDRAIVISRVAVEKNPSTSRLRIQLALLEMEHGSPSKAVQITQNLLEENKTDPSLWLLYARALDRDGKKEEAQNAIRIAEQVQKEYTESLELHR